MTLSLIMFLAACSTRTDTKTTRPFGLATTQAAEGAATMLTFTTQPGGATSGLPFSTPPVVTIEDSSGKTVIDSDASVTLFITAGADAEGGTLSGDTTVNAVNGVATFTDISIDVVGSYYSLTASSHGLTSAVSKTFSVTPGTPARLEFITEPVAAGAGSAFSTQPVVAVEDAQGNIVTDSQAPVTLTIKPGTGTDGAKLTGKTTVNAENGIAVFTYLSIDMEGNDYALMAESPGLTPDVSDQMYVGVPTGTP